MSAKATLLFFYSSLFPIRSRMNSKLQTLLSIIINAHTLQNFHRYLL